MWVEITTGKDSLRAQGASMRRNVSVASFVRVKDDGEGNTVVPLFAAFQKKLKGFKETSLVSTIPATDHYGPEYGGGWYVNRHELLAGSEILLEYRRRSSTPGSFAEEVEYLLLICDMNAPLWQVRLTLPQHHLSAVPYVFFTGRFDIVNKDAMLTQEAIDVWKDFLCLDEEHHVSDLLDPTQDERFFAAEELEPRIKKTSDVQVKETASGQRRVKIRRVRNIRTSK